MHSFISPQPPNAPLITDFFYEPIFLFSQNNMFLSSVFAFCLLFIQAIVLNNLVINYQILERNSFIPAFTYLTCMSLFPEYTNLNNVLIFNTFIILSCSILFKIYNKEDAFIEIFNLSLLVSVASLFFSPGVLILIFLWLSLAILNVLKLREWFISSMGFLIPILFVWFYFFWNNIDMTSIYYNIKLFSFTWMENVSVKNYSFFSLILFILLVLFSISKYLSESRGRVIMQRKFAAVFNWLFVFFIIVLLGTNNVIPNSLIISIPTAIFIASFSINEKNQWKANMPFYLLFLIFCFNHFISPTL
ncbi:MAG: hypothetical protein PHT69_10010 [Bacteroidales bacterium]|nr:hypothetical protein [Bacteroidales bacterium]